MLHARCALVSLCAIAVAGCEVPPPADAVWVTIPPGDSIAAVAESLAAYDIVQSAERFERFARINRRHLGIEAGTYPLRPNRPMGEVLATLRRGTPPVTPVTIRARTTLAEVAVLLERSLGIAAESIEAAARDAELLERVGARAETLEGYLFPTQYYVRTEADAHELLRQMADTFEARWLPHWTERLGQLGMTRHEIVTLASIVEGEAPHEADRPYVSSVYHNRLERGMRLQADPTVIYALGGWRRLSRDDLAVESPYNTYRVNGLPPGPINQPSTASIVAALYPAPSEYLYLVADASGRHYFSRTYRQHLSMIRQIRSGDTMRGRGVTN
jgi:UPF0755 protein